MSILYNEIAKVKQLIIKAEKELRYYPEQKNQMGNVAFRNSVSGRIEALEEVVIILRRGE